MRWFLVAKLKRKLKPIETEINGLTEEDLSRPAQCDNGDLAYNHKIGKATANEWRLYCVARKHWEAKGLEFCPRPGYEQNVLRDERMNLALDELQESLWRRKKAVGDIRVYINGDREVWIGTHKRYVG